METKILFRPSELGKIMPNARTKAKEGQEIPHLAEGVKTFLRQKMIELKYKRFKNIENKYITKGKDCEEKAITAYSIIKGRIFENNKQRVQNDYFSGEIDLAWLDKNGIITEITDIKNSYNVHTFFDNENNVKKDNYYQGLGYLDLNPTAEKYHIANILVDNTDDAILNELYREGYKWKDGETPAYRQIEIIKEHIYTKERFDNLLKLCCIAPVCEKSEKEYNNFIEIPLNERLIEHTFTRAEVAEDIEAVKNRVAECRLYLDLVYNIKHVE